MKVKYKYSKDESGLITGHPPESIGHQDGEYTFMPIYTKKYKWIKTKCLYDTEQEAKSNPPAQYL